MSREKDPLQEIHWWQLLMGWLLPRPRFSEIWEISHHAQRSISCLGNEFSSSPQSNRQNKSVKRTLFSLSDMHWTFFLFLIAILSASLRPMLTKNELNASAIIALFAAILPLANIFLMLFFFFFDLFDLICHFCIVQTGLNNTHFSLHE